MSFPPNEPNPYEAPQTLEPARIDLSDRPIDKHILEQFREQIRALCVVWFVVGVSVSVLAVVTTGVPDFNAMFGISPLSRFWNAHQVEMGVVLFGLGIAFCGLAIAVGFRQIWAIHALTGLGTFTLVLSFVVQLPIGCCGMLPLMLIAMQGYRVARWAKRLEEAGIPLHSA